ncbi:DUF2255 family protein, partial [Streptomyces rubiginosohelvolus]
MPVGDRIFIRSYNGTQGKWYGPALKTGRGRISAGGVDKPVRFVPVDPDDEETNQGRRRFLPGEVRRQRVLGDDVDRAGTPQHPGSGPRGVKPGCVRRSGAG